MFQLSKKGVLTVYLLVFVIIAVSISLFLFTGDSVEKYFIIGDSQMKVLEVYSNAEVDLFIYEESLKVLISSLIFDFSEKGGVINRSNYNQYNYWERGSKKCYPTLEDLKINLNSYLLQDQNNKNISLDYYNSTIWVNKNYSKLYLLDLDDLNINYNFDINLSIPYPMALSSFEEILQEISFVSSSCNNNITCWGALFNATTKSIEIYPLNEGKTFNIEVTSQNMKDSLTNAEVVIKGAIDFEYNPLTQGEFEC